MRRHTPQDARDLILAALLPPVRDEVWRARNELQELEQNPGIRLSEDLSWLIAPMCGDWTWEQWWKEQRSPAWAIPETDGPELDRWLVEKHVEKVFWQGWEQRLFDLDGPLICMQTETRMGEETTCWPWERVAKLMPEAGVYQSWTPQEVEALEFRWPEWVDLEQIWIGSGSDLVVDRWTLAQGPAEKMLDATQRFARVEKKNGREAGIILNAWYDQLTPLQAAILMPGALKRNKLLRLL